MKRILGIVLLWMAVAAGSHAFAIEATLTLYLAEVTGIDGREPEQSYPGATTMDAVHRAVLLRFPDAPKRILARIDEGSAIVSATLELDYDGHEIAPQGYVTRGLGRAAWAADPPRWHVVAWALRQPWASGEGKGPTFNAFINGAGYWRRYGASDTSHDRFTMRLGLSELSHANPVALLDLTPLLADAVFGSDLGARLKVLGESGLLLKKLEDYDRRYRAA